MRWALAPRRYRFPFGHRSRSSRIAGSGVVLWAVRVWPGHSARTGFFSVAGRVAPVLRVPRGAVGWPCLAGSGSHSVAGPVRWRGPSSPVRPVPTWCRGRSASGGVGPPSGAGSPGRVPPGAMGRPRSSGQPAGAGSFSVAGRVAPLPRVPRGALGGRVSPVPAPLRGPAPCGGVPAPVRPVPTWCCGPSASGGSVRPAVPARPATGRVAPSAAGCRRCGGPSASRRVSPPEPVPSPWPVAWPSGGA